QLTRFEDERVLTLESIQLTVTVAMWWKVSNLEKYFYQIDPEFHAIKDEGMPEPEFLARERDSPRGPRWIAEQWVRTLAESCLRTLISDTSAAQIVSQRAASYLHVEEVPSEQRHPGSLPSTEPAHLLPATPRVIARRVQDMLNDKVAPYGLEIDRVEVQEVQLPPGIQEAVEAAWTAHTLPAKAGKEAQARKIQLQAVGDGLGKGGAAVT